MDDERAPTDWEARVAKAKRDGTWGTDDEEPSPYPPVERRRRFWVGFVSAFVGCLVLGAVLHVVRGRPGSPVGLDALLDSLAPAFFAAFLVGWSATRGSRKR